MIIRNPIRRRRWIIIRYIAYGLLLLLCLVVLIYFIKTKRFKLIDWITFITISLISKLADHMIGIANELYHHVQDGKAQYYFAMFYDILVYPIAGVIFAKLLPEKKTIWRLAIYNLAWIVSAILFESLYLRPFKVIIYTGWRIIPDSLIFYILFFPVFTWYVIFIEKKFVNSMEK